MDNVESLLNKIKKPTKKKINLLNTVSDLPQILYNEVYYIYTPEEIDRVLGLSFLKELGVRVGEIEGKSNIHYYVFNKGFITGKLGKDCGKFIKNLNKIDIPNEYYKHYNIKKDIKISNILQEVKNCIEVQPFGDGNGKIDYEKLKKVLEDNLK